MLLIVSSEDGGNGLGIRYGTLEADANSMSAQRARRGYRAWRNCNAKRRSHRRHAAGMQIVK
jgi:hypothetical protein